MARILSELIAAFLRSSPLLASPAFLRYIHVTTCKPRVELALRYSIRARFMKAKTSEAFNARVDELFALLKPGEDELATIMRHARQIGQAIDGEIGQAHPKTRRRAR